MIFYLLIVAVLLIILIISSIQFYSIIFKNYAPFISSKKILVKKAITEIKLSGIILDETKNVYELGCGKADFLKSLEKNGAKANLIGLEYYFFPFIIAKIIAKFRGSKVKILRQDFFKADLKEADLIYCYLNIKMMKILKEKFKKECQPGTIIISNTFSLPETEPYKVIKNKDDSVYFYKL